MPVQVAPVTLSPVPSSDTYVATIKSRRSATMQPQVDGNLVKIFVKSGDLVQPGQVLMRIDPLKQLATVQSQRGTQSQKKAVYDYARIELDRQQQLAYYDIRAPFSGVVGDIPVHLGDYVSPTTLLTTVDENTDLEAYIYVPTERASVVRQGLPVEIIDTAGNVLVKSTISFISPQVDNGLQSILA